MAMSPRRSSATVYKIDVVSFIPAALIPNPPAPIPTGLPPPLGTIQVQANGNNHGLGLTGIFDQPTLYKTDQQVYVMTGSPDGQTMLPDPDQYAQEMGGNGVGPSSSSTG